MATEPKGYPVLLAFPRSDIEGGVRAWCPYCRAWHYHGGGAGHRAAHCHDPLTRGGVRSPFREDGGYYLRPLSKRDAKELFVVLQRYVGEP